jgi:flagellar basal body-associated protein FliL
MIPTWLVIYLIVVVIIIAVAIITAPTGYEDKEGFHKGKENKKEN